MVVKSSLAVVQPGTTMTNLVQPGREGDEESRASEKGFVVSQGARARYRRIGWPGALVPRSALVVYLEGVIGCLGA